MNSRGETIDYLKSVSRTASDLVMRRGFSDTVEDGGVELTTIRVGRAKVRVSVPQ